MYHLMVLEAESQKSRFQQSHDPPKTRRGGILPCSTSFWKPQPFLGLWQHHSHHHTLFPLRLFCLPFVRVCACVHVSSTPVTGPGPTILSSSQLDHWHRPCFRMAHSQGLGVRTSTCLLCWEGSNSTRNTYPFSTGKGNGVIAVGCQWSSTRV